MHFAYSATALGRVAKGAHWGMRGATSLANCNLLMKGFGNAVDRDACTGTAQWSSGDGVGFSMVWRWFNKVWLE